MEQYPLHWPGGWPRCKYPRSSQFGKSARPSISKACDKVMHELKLLGAKNIVISTNLRYREDGIPYSRQNVVSDCGVAIYFQMGKEQRVIACDAFDQIGCNIFAIGKTVEAMRGISRWGASELMNRAFSGFKALMEPAQPEWYEVLQVSENASDDVVMTSYRDLAKRYHPDMPTANRAKFDDVQHAYETWKSKKS